MNIPAATVTIGHFFNMVNRNTIQVSDTQAEVSSGEEGKHVSQKVCAWIFIAVLFTRAKKV